eukprot:TRINITY_DN9481_c0_g1_i1.p1 TRINITY_DN9481_c0_g1~~TRINITY_DN9481_c0_g1_i1.p1  ORF type:complete len:557 (+),score=55.57 TRINITY_DN9481_c0_g1_i1:44-1672(+)
MTTSLAFAVRAPQPASGNLPLSVDAADRRPVPQGLAASVSGRVIPEAATWGRRAARHAKKSGRSLATAEALPLLAASSSAWLAWRRRRRQRCGNCPPSHATTARAQRLAGCSWWRRRPGLGVGAGDDDTADAADAADTTEEKKPSEPPIVIFAAVFLHLLGFTMSGPMMPSLRAHFGIAISQTGLITSAFPLGMFGAVFVFPVLSDIIGRKRVLVASYLGVGLGFLLQALAVGAGASFQTFLKLRVLSGAMAGASIVVKAYIADISTPKTLPAYMAWRESAATLAFIVGPTIGGLVIANTTLPTTIFLEGATSILAAGLVAFCLPRSRKQKSGQKSVKPKASRDAYEGVECPIKWGAPWLPIITTMIIGCVYNFGQSFFDGFFSLLCHERFALSAPLIGAVQTCMALVVFTGTAGVYGRMVNRIGLVETATLGLALIASGLFMLGLPGSLAGLLAGVAVYAMGIPLFSPSVPTLLTQCAPANRRGLILGIDSALNSVGRILAPAVLGRLYEMNPTKAFSLVSSVVAVGAAVMVFERRRFGLS